MKNKIWLSTVEKIKDELGSKGGHLWEKLDFELQDNHEFLLIILDVSYPPNEELHESIQMLLKDIVETKIPNLEDDYPWTCVIRYKGEVVDSISPNFLERPKV